MLRSERRSAGYGLGREHLVSVRFQRPATVRFHPRTSGSGAVQAVSPRLAGVVAAAQPADAFVLLLGERGNGRIHLATAAAHAVSDAGPGRATSTVTVLPTPPALTSGVSSVFGDDFNELCTPQERSEAILDSIAGEGTQATLVAPYVDNYSPGDLQLLRLIVASPRAPRVIATATSLTGAIESLTRGLSHTKLAVGPLNEFEANDYLSSLLGVQRIEHDTLTRWLTRSRGKSYALAALALASESSGRVQRSNGVAWVARHDDQVPTDFAELHTLGCTAAELELLEFVAIAEPITETTLLRSLDANLLAQLFDQGFLSWRQSAHQQALVLTHVMVAESLRSRMSPPRQHAVYDTVFELLDEDRQGLDPLHVPERLIRLVTFGLHANRRLPQQWLWAAFELGARRSDPELALVLAQQVAAHPEVTSQQRGVAQLEVKRLALLLGSPAAARLIEPAIGRLLEDPRQAGELAPSLLAALQVARVRLHFYEHRDAQRALGELSTLEAHFADAAPAVSEIVRAARIHALAGLGRLRETFESRLFAEVTSDLAVEWVRSPARGSMAMILAQQGHTERASALAKHMYSLSQLGPRARRDYVDLHTFCWVLSNCLGGHSERAAEICESLAYGPVQFASAESHHAGFLSTAQVFVSIQAGRWSDAAQQTEQLLNRFTRYDYFGLTPLVAAARAFVLAVLGERDGAIECLRLAEDTRFGVSQTLGGVRWLFVVRAHQWLREADVVAMAASLTDWANREGVELIELLALHISCYEQQGLTALQLQRARDIGDRIESDQAPALLAHIERICDPDLDDDAPEVRLLAELGVWLPLPPATGLSAREREVALLAALGHTTKFIAARLVVSTRTIEAHLAHIFAKVGVGNRDELSVWFARRPSLMAEAAVHVSSDTASRSSSRR